MLNSQKRDQSHVDDTTDLPQTTLAWEKSSWRSKQISQQAEYPDQELLSQELRKMQTLPPIVAAEEVKTLKQSLVDVHNGKGFILQVGDCAEKFSDCNAQTVQRKVWFYDLLGNLFTELSGLPTVVIGRMAGQFAKPRTELYEDIDGKKTPTFRGENINSFDLSERTPNSKRLTEGYFKSTEVINYARQMKDIDLVCAEFNEKLNHLNNKSVSGPVPQQQIQALSPRDSILLQRDVFTSHEALMLDYEETQIRKEGDSYFCLSAHFLWIGMRTNLIDGAHVEFFRGLKNPIGVKLSKDVANSEESLQNMILMIKLLNPENEEGKLTLILRFGAKHVETTLPKVLRAVQEENLKVLWVIDGVHGNTQKVGSFKTRKIEDIKQELIHSLKVFAEHKVRLNGIHLEITPDDVTECLGGEHSNVTHTDLERRYTSYCDPRLNFSQSIEVISDVAREMNKLIN